MEEKGLAGVESPQPSVEESFGNLPDTNQSDIDFNSNPDPQLFVVQEDGASPVIDDKSDAGSGPITLLGAETYPEGGLEAWLVVFGSFCGLCASLGIMNTIAIFQTYLATHQLSDYSEGTIGWIFSLYTFLCFAGGIYVGPMFDKYGPKWLVSVGSVGIVVSMMLLSICTDYWHFLLAFGVLNGLASSACFTPCFTTIGHYFRERRGMATGIASTGGGVGGVVFPLMLQRLFNQVGYAWAIRILGLVCMVLFIFAMLLVRKRLPPASNASTHPDFRIFKEKAFFLTTCGVFLLELGLFIPLAYISSYAVAQGFSSAFAFQILPILNAASVFGRALPGYWADKIGPFNSNMLSVFLTVVSVLGIWLPVGHTMPGIIIFVILFGFGTGNNISITPVCVGRLCHTQHYGRYYATCYTIVSIACLVGIPIAGTLAEATGGNYWSLIVFTGLTQCLSFSFFAAAKVVSVGWKPQVKF
ncbi:major facilitator superfamily domain-containing protein [Pseudomassariella vexata]|uniref:Major facilitator superfamily domain-containing protein n=1 Tax=Pseudomassariella vexata TaxID=1141098 RepID=A0A1Y2E771_9PEZI|nr:major facilitator superfamily domain-containing protein [Pseudomassariella vexata]ORY67390.1 major facilitator superfamily domain-containing protein [Pseudomassariella vexata]